MNDFLKMEHGFLVVRSWAQDLTTDLNPGGNPLSGPSEPAEAVFPSFPDFSIKKSITRPTSCCVSDRVSAVGIVHQVAARGRPVDRFFPN